MAQDASARQTTRDQECLRCHEERCAALRRGPTDAAARTDGDGGQSIAEDSIAKDSGLRL